MAGMEKTTVYLTTEQKAALARTAGAEGRSEARLIRDGIDAVTSRHRTGETATVLGGGGRADADGVPDDGPRRPRWMARDEFVRRILPYPADAALRSELAELSPDSTDDAELR
jgi:hypothetical protein